MFSCAFLHTVGKHRAHCKWEDPVGGVIVWLSIYCEINVKAKN